MHSAEAVTPGARRTERRPARAGPARCRPRRTGRGGSEGRRRPLRAPAATRSTGREGSPAAPAPSSRGVLAAGSSQRPSRPMAIVAVAYRSGSSASTTDVRRGERDVVLAGAPARQHGHADARHGMVRGVRGRVDRLRRHRLDERPDGHRDRRPGIGLRAARGVLVEDVPVERRVIGVLADHEHLEPGGDQRRARVGKRLEGHVGHLDRRGALRDGQRHGGSSSPRSSCPVATG